MDVAAAVATGPKLSTNTLPFSATGRNMVSTTNLFQPAVWASPMRPDQAGSRSLCSIFTSRQEGRSFPTTSHSSTLFLPRCSTKPGIGSNNATNQNATVGVGSNSTSQQLASSPPNQALGSTCPKGLVFDLGPTNSWDGTEIGSPIVKRYIGDNEERWYMWYHGNNNNKNPCDSVGLAISSNGIHWGRGGDAGVAMTCRQNWWAFDTDSIRPSEMVIMSSPMYGSVYWLYYTGHSTEEVEIPKLSIENPERSHSSDQPAAVKGKIFKSLPGLACSQDGRHWARIEGDHHSGAILDVGSSKEWDSLFIAKPHVVLERSDDLRMYYHSFDAENGHFAIGMARSRDGIRWVKLGKIMGAGASGSFDAFGVKNACVVRNRREGNYLMAYEGVSEDGKRSIGLAESPDGLKNWKRVQEEAVVEASEEEGWDNKAVGSPCLVQMEGNVDEWRLYYVGESKGGRTGIGMAVSEGSNVRSFRRWTGFHL